MRHNGLFHWIAASLCWLALSHSFAALAVAQSNQTTNLTANHNTDISESNSTNPLLISATLEAREAQVVTSPYAGSWQIGVQWLAPEQSYVKAGQPVAVFDAGSLQSTIAGFDNDLLRLADEQALLAQEQQLKVLEAQFELTRQQLLLEKAQLDAAVPVSQRSRYDYDLFQLQLKRQQTETNKAQQALLLAQQTANTVQAKKQLDIRQITEKRTLAQQQLSTMQVLASHDGLVSYGTHPWYRTKLNAGSTVQPGWEIARVQSATQLHIQAWVHEADVAALRQASRFNARFDAYPKQQFALQLDQVAAQGELFAKWGEAAYYRATFKAEQLPDLPLMLGMGMLVEVLP